MSVASIPGEWRGTCATDGGLAEQTPDSPHCSNHAAKDPVVQSDEDLVADIRSTIEYVNQMLELLPARGVDFEINTLEHTDIRNGRSTQILATFSRRL